VNYIHPDGLGQWQESGRDQGHTTMGIGIMGAICEMAWRQGDDLYGYDNNRFLAGCEYVAKYNLGEDVPFKPYANDKGTQPSSAVPQEGMCVRSGTGLQPLRKTQRLVRSLHDQDGGEIETGRWRGDYGPNSGGFDQLGFGTLTATLDKNTEQKDTSWPFGTPPKAQ